MQSYSLEYKGYSLEQVTAIRVTLGGETRLFTSLDEAIKAIDAYWSDKVSLRDLDMALEQFP
jgi:hypothetical protein